MSGSSIAYHLRQNKTIERNLFVDLLARVGRVRNISEYEYIGFGGPLLEDYKALHAALRIKRMHSIERDENTFKRQRFNRPAKFVTLHCTESSEFFRHHQFNAKGTVVWLDYTRPSELNQQLQELNSVVAKCDSYDVVKVTLNAEPAGLGGETAKTHERASMRLQILQERIPEYVPTGLTAEDLTAAKYPLTLQKCVQKCISDLSGGTTGRYFHILSSFVYKDGQQMLTVTGMVFRASDDPMVAEFIAQSRIKHWPFANLNWEPPIQISVPALSAKERMKLDECLPLGRHNPEMASAKLKKQLGYVPGSDATELANYARYYRAYPHFSRVIF